MSFEQHGWSIDVFLPGSGQVHKRHTSPASRLRVPELATALQPGNFQQQRKGNAVTRIYEPDPYQADYEQEKAAGFPGQGNHEARPAGTYPAPVAARTAVTIPPRKLITAGVIAVLVIVAAIIGHAIASSDSIAVGDCVVTNPAVLTGWDIKKVACNSNPGSGLEVQQVESVQNGSDGQCDVGLTTFQDQPASKTYCLNTYSLGDGG